MKTWHEIYTFNKFYIIPKIFFHLFCVCVSAVVAYVWYGIYESLPRQMPWNFLLFFVQEFYNFHIMFILQARLQQYVNREIPDVQAGFRKGRGTRDQIVNICWIMEKAREFQKNIYFCFIDYAKAFDCVDHKKLENSERDGYTRPPDLSLEKSLCMSGSNG